MDIGPVTPVKSKEIKNAENLFDNEHFKLWRIISEEEFTVGLKDLPTILVCLDGKGTMKFNDTTYSIDKGEVMILPAIIGPLDFHPEQEITLLQIAIPDTELK
ncbi:MAG: hypothetical protein ACTIJ9_13670 [Aequorivita sp.]